MIQRIQSLFLIVALILQVLMLFFPYSEFTINNEVVKITGMGFNPDVLKYDNSIAIFSVMIFICFSVLIPLIAIFLYKNRKLQMRWCIFYFIILLGFQLVLFWFSWSIKEQTDAIVAYKIPIIFPVISAILSYLAFLSIRKDERLIKSIDRIR